MTDTHVKLTSYSHGAGCACKLPWQTLSELLTLLGPQADVPENILVGLDEADDAAVVALEGDDALVLTLDFFTPLVDDAFTWGQIAAANAASDVYAMGGRPFVALNIVAWPREQLGVDLLAQVLLGAREVATRGSYVVVGGHSIDDPEPKFGQVVVGRADRNALMTMDGASAGDVLVLTKPVGTGIVTTAIKNDAAPADVASAAIASMTRLNDAASKVLLAHRVRGCTDVTGFGLLGHLHRMSRSSGVAAEVDAAAVPLIGGAVDLALAGSIPGGTKRNHDAVAERVEWDNSDELTRMVLCDAQTSGGLLAAVAEDVVDDVIAALDGEFASAVIGRVVDGAPGTISVYGNVV